MEVTRKAESPNTTLNMLVSLDGTEYYNLIDGATDTLQFLRGFFKRLGTARTCSLGVLVYKLGISQSWTICLHIIMKVEKF